MQAINRRISKIAENPATIVDSIVQVVDADNGDVAPNGEEWTAENGAGEDRCGNPCLTKYLWQYSHGHKDQHP